MTARDLLEAALDPDAWMQKAMERDKPLHVNVAEALGCKPEPPYSEWSDWRCACPQKRFSRLHAAHAIHNDCCHNIEGGCDGDELARYDTDWSATGPLIERFRIMVQPEGESTLWMASMDRPDWQCPFGAEGQTSLEAVCNLILALHESGKLPSPSSEAP